MYRIRITDEKNRYELTELAKMFVSSSDLFINAPDMPLDNSESLHDSCDEGFDFVVPNAAVMDRNAQKRELYRFLSENTGKTLDWGTLTGVRPAKLFGQLVKRKGSPAEAEKELKNTYYVSDEKVSLLKNTWEVQSPVIARNSKGAAGVYVGIPFCPTRCLYCSFTSNKFVRENAEKYLAALKKEIAATAEIMSRKGIFADSVYIGGGTPTSLPGDMFEEMVTAVAEAFVRPETAEFTVECGRPDTITVGKLKALKKAGADRISINPQTMKASTLELIGRQHSPEQIIEAYNTASGLGIENINMDLIAGLPEETPEDFRDTLNKIIALDPANITVHTLAVKKGSKLIEKDKEYSYKSGDVVREMLSIGNELLTKAGYRPYYLYRQKHMTGNFENVGWAKEGKASAYNIHIMEEDQSIIALGAGGVSKVYFPEEDRLERVANVSNYEIYIDRIDEMIERKEKGL